MYANDILIFCIAKTSNIKTLKSIFKDYSSVSSQNINLSKSSLFYGSISSRKINKLIRLTGFQHGIIPFNYLGVPLFKGTVKKYFLSPIVDRYLSKLSRWKVYCLSMDDRLTLVKSIIHGMLAQSINI
ncbi:hypothetical protein KIW84_031581 [Lathyrus oleraceus]|uniref:Reverse transcriptase n=1 Tax=Pisum sativum TaxID=3888 RepID=A0A9D5B110_PEA|nr:hypothetical protein KIW84_031581 [Pisum sativum]